MGAACFYNPFFRFLRHWAVITCNFILAAGLLTVQIMFVPYMPLWVAFLAFAIIGLVTCCNTGCMHPDDDEHHHHRHHDEHTAPVVQYQYVAPAAAPAYQAAYTPAYQQVAPHPASQPAGPPPPYGSAGAVAPPPAYASAPTMSEWSK